MGGPGSGRYPTVPTGRGRMRDVVLNKERWVKFVAAIDAQLANGNPDAFLRAFEHGYGRPPQALDVRSADVTPGEQVIYAATFGDGESVPGTNGSTHTPAPDALPVPTGTPDGPSA